MRGVWSTRFSPRRSGRALASGALILFAGFALLLAAGCRSPGANVKPTLARFFLESADGQGMPLTLPQSEVRLTVNSRPVFTEADIVNVEIAQVELGRCLAFQLSSSATRDCYRLTGTSQGRRLVLAINGEPFGARRIERPIADGLILIFVELPDTALPQLVADMKRSIAAVQRESGKK